MASPNKTPLFRFGLARKLQHSWVRHRWADLLVALLIIAAWLLAGKQEWIPLGLEDVAPPQRQATYQVIATIAGTMAGFTLTSVSVLVNLLRTPMSTIDRLLPDSDKGRVGNAVIGVLPSLALLFASALCGHTRGLIDLPGPLVDSGVCRNGAAAFGIRTGASHMGVLRRLLDTSTMS
ncbi:MAG: hypothetical protein CME34_19650 [Gordonia sp.]|uniref:hypothetical protein n=1 Tax=Gordonia sp. (in: high G+C Gram-positive bacteria) TaxID=84139 RepID=UPI000C666B72|nr:hypothetical protein [Gordonia sp. (in: high G+C Gram-positive bacteria)]MAU84040.1 hypothetical protein [Gordonia sp. (in: high G+C Gram-positive bacteria)]